MSGAVLLKPKKPELLPARSVVVAPRMPKLDARKYTGNPFTSEGDVVLDCGTPLPDGSPCGWHAMGTRADTKKAWQEHYRLYHAGNNDTGVVLLNAPRE